MKTILVYQAYESETIKYETVYSILSFIYYHGIAQEILIHIQTDDKAFFEKFFFKTKISYHLLTSVEIKKIKKDNNLKQQVKIDLLNNVRQSTNDNVLYVHSNTYFTKRNEALLQGLAYTESIIGCCEECFANLSGLSLSSILSKDLFFHYGQEDNYGERIFSWVKNREATMEGNMVCQCLDLDLPEISATGVTLWQKLKTRFFQ